MFYHQILAICEILEENTDKSSNFLFIWSEMNVSLNLHKMHDILYIIKKISSIFLY